MNLRHFRNRLLTELSNLPELRSQEVQSYVLTTAILTRRVMEVLNHSGLQIPSTYNPKQPNYELKTILDSFIHYRAFYPKLGSLDETQPFVVRLYSDDDRSKGKEYSIRLSDYFDLISRIANDDLMVAKDLLLPRVVTRLNQVIRVQADFDTDHLNAILSLVVDTLELADSLDQAGSVQLPSNVVVNAHEITSLGDMQSEGGWQSRVFALDGVDFVKGYNTTWQLSPFPASRNLLSGVDAYAVAMEASQRHQSALPGLFAVTFEQILVMCKAISDSVMGFCGNQITGPIARI